MHRADPVRRAPRQASPTGIRERPDSSADCPGRSKRSPPSRVPRAAGKLPAAQHKPARNTRKEGAGGDGRTCASVVLAHGGTRSGPSVPNSVNTLGGAGLRRAAVGLRPAGGWMGGKGNGREMFRGRPRPQTQPYRGPPPEQSGRMAALPSPASISESLLRPPAICGSAVTFCNIERRCAALRSLLSACAPPRRWSARASRTARRQSSRSG